MRGTWSASAVSVAAAAAVILLAGCNGATPTSPSSVARLTERIVTPHFVFNYSADDRVDTEWQEAYHAWAVAQLGVTPAVIQYNKYRDRGQMGAITGRGNTNGYAEPSASTIHTIWPTDNHEVVHVYAGPWGSPAALFVEGLAVAHQANPPAGIFTPRWNGTPVHELARRFRSQGQLLPIASIAESVAFRSRDAEITYPQSGSFVRFLIDTEGIAPMRRLYGSMSNDAPLAAVRAAFLQVYGFSLDEAERRWLEFLTT
jgi:hypothetical protein